MTLNPARTKSKIDKIDKIKITNRDDKKDITVAAQICGKFRLTTIFTEAALLQCSRLGNKQGAFCVSPVYYLYLSIEQVENIQNG